MAQVVQLLAFVGVLRWAPRLASEGDDESFANEPEGDEESFVNEPGGEVGEVADESGAREGVEREKGIWVGRFAGRGVVARSSS